MSESERDISKKKSQMFTYLSPMQISRASSSCTAPGASREVEGERPGVSQGSLHSAPGREGLSSGTFCPAPVSWEAVAITFYTVLVGNPSHSLRSRKNSKGNVTLS